MPRTMSAAALEAMFDQQTSEVILPLLVIDEASLPAPIRVVNNTVDVTRLSNVYTALRFMIAPPTEDAGTIKQVTLAIDNISRVVRDAIELANGQPTIELTYVRAADLDGTPEAGPFDFVVESASYDVRVATLSLRYTEVFKLRYPAHSFIPAFFPDLFD